MKHLLVIAALAGALSACGGNESPSADAAREPAASTCPKAWQAGWQRLADRIAAPVYCPRWLPSPLTGLLGGSTASLSVSPDRSYLVTFLDQHEGFEQHATMRGYPGTTEIPECRVVDVLDGGKTVESKAACFAERSGTRRVGGFEVTVYGEGLDADEHHVVYAWQHEGSLYTLGHHAQHSVTRSRAMANLDRIMRSLAVVEPS